MKIISTIQLSEKLINMCQELGDYVYIPAKEVKIEDVSDVDICIGNVPTSYIPEMRNLKWLQLDSAGSDQYAPVVSENCILTNGSGTFGASIAEHIIMVILMAFRNMPFYVESKTAHRYERIIGNKLINGSTFLILGTGDLGSECAKRIQLLGGKTIGLKRTAVSSLQYFDEVNTMDHLKEYLPSVDGIILCLPANVSTTYIINKETLKLVKNDVVIVNVGRGNAINEEDLIHSLINNEIGCACLDVYEKEPLPKESLLWDLENCILTPHVAGNYANSKTFELFYEIVEENIQHYKNKEKLRNEVDRTLGY